MTGFISEVCYDSTAAQDFVEIVLPAGTDASSFRLALYNKASRYQRSVELEDAESQTDAADVYLVDRYTQSFGQINQHTSLALIDGDGTVVQFVSFGGRSITAKNGPARGEASKEIGTASGRDALQSMDGKIYEATNVTSRGTLPCFAPGTRIDTASGQTLIEAITVGDLVQTQDHRLQPVCWIRRCHRDCSDKGQVPILIPSGAFGWGKPMGDLIVSAQHRMLLDGKRQGRRLVDGPVLVPAHALVGWRGIRRMQGRSNQTWHHIAFDRHEVVRANGCMAESLLLGPMAITGLSAIQRHDVAKIYAKQLGKDHLNGPPAHRMLNGNDAKMLLFGQRGM